MGRGDQALLHQVYPTEVQGDTAVLKPRGDAAGFTLHTISTELTHVRDLITSGRVKNLLVDLGYHRYFGSMVIGDLIELAQLVRSQGGRTGLCGISDDMESVLRLFQLEDHWERFDSRGVALQSLANLSTHQRMWRMRYPLVTTAACLTLFLLYWFYPRPDLAVVYHDKLDRLWEEVSSKRDQIGIDEWSRVAKKTKAQLAPIIDRLEARVKSRRASSGEKYLLVATKYHWLPWLTEDNGGDEARDRQLTDYFLKMAQAKSMGLPAPQEPQILYASSDTRLPTDPAIDRGDGSSSSDYRPVPVPPAEAVVLPVSGSNEQGAEVSVPEADGSQSTETQTMPI